MPPDNAGYMYAAYAAAGVIYGAYALSIWWRARRIARRRPLDGDDHAAHVPR
jgi:hypothetical protein